MKRPGLIQKPLPFSPASQDDAQRLERLTRENLKKAPLMGYAGVGTLGEKRMHAILKHFLAEDEDYHEVGVLDTGYVSDVRIGNKVYEVQSGSVYPLKPKIDHYLNKTDCEVIVVHPMVYGGVITRIDPKSGTVLSRRKTPVKESPLFFLADLYALRAFLQNERLSFRLLFLEVEDFRLPHRGRGKREKIEKIPSRLLGELTLASADDYKALIPDALPASFSASEFMKVARLPSRASYSVLHVLAAAGALQEEKPAGKPFVFTRI